MSLQNRDSQTQLEKDLNGCQGKGWVEGIIREFGMDVYTPLYLKWIANKDLLQNTGNSAQCYVAAWMGGEFGREWTRVYIRLSPFAVHLKLVHITVNQLYSNTKEKVKKKKKDTQLSLTFR